MKIIRFIRLSPKLDSPNGISPSVKIFKRHGHGKTAVSGDIGGHSEIFQGCETGVLFQAGNVESLAQTR